MLVIVFCIAIVLVAAGYTWMQDAKDGINK